MKKGERLDVIVRLRHMTSASQDIVGRLGGRVRHSLRSSGSIAVTLPAAGITALAENAAVEYVASDPMVVAHMDVARQAANLPEAPVHESSLRGAGVAVAIVDSGVAFHPELGNLVGSVDFVEGPASWSGGPPPASSGGSDPSGAYADSPPLLDAPSSDPYGHGTHVAGIVGGTGGYYRGVAPEASLVSVRVLDGEGRGQTSTVIAALDWVVANKEQLGIRVLNLSMGHAVYEPLANDPLVQAVEAAWDAGIVVVCSAGNRGRDGYGTISSPCNSPKVITVGALNDRGTADPGDDAVTTFSSRGPTRFDLVSKPDLLAPGNRIVSANSEGSYFDTSFPERRRSDHGGAHGAYFEMSGTSMAAPMVAGAAALMLQQEPWLSPGSVKARLMLSARKPAAGTPFDTGAGALDITAALRQGGLVPGAPSPRVFVDADGGRLGFENTAVLWGDTTFSLGSLWPEVVVWADGGAWDEPIRWSHAALVGDGSLWPDTTVWSAGSLWPETAVWGDGSLWPDSTVSGDDGAIGPEQQFVEDP